MFTCRAQFESELQQCLDGTKYRCKSQHGDNEAEVRACCLSTGNISDIVSDCCAEELDDSLNDCFDQCPAQCSADCNETRRVEVVFEEGVELP